MSQSKIEALKNSHRRSAIKQEILPHAEPLMRPTRDTITDNKTTALHLKQTHAIDTSAYQKRVQQLERELEDYQFEHQANQVYNRQFKVLGKLFGNEQLEFEEILKKIEDTILNSNMGSGFGSSNETVPFHQPYKVGHSLENDHFYEQVFRYSHEELKAKLIEANRSQFLSILNLGSSMTLEGQSQDQRKKKQLRQKFFIIWRQIVDEANFQDKTIKNESSLFEASRTEEKISNFERQILQKNKHISELAEQLQKVNQLVYQTQSKQASNNDNYNMLIKQYQLSKTHSEDLLVEISGLKKQLHTYQDRLYEYQQKQNVLGQQNRLKEQRIKQLLQQLKQIKRLKQDECKSMINRIDQLIQNINKYDVNIINLESQKNQLLRQLWVCKANVQTFQNRVNQNQVEIGKLKQVREQLERDLERANKSMQQNERNNYQESQSRISQLNRQLMLLRQQYEQKQKSLTSTLHEINAQKSELQTQLYEAQREIQLYKEKLVEKENQVGGRLSEDLGTHEADQKIHEVEEHYKMEMDRLESKIEVLESTRTQLQSQISEQNIHYQRIINELHIKSQVQIRNYEQQRRTYEEQRRRYEIRLQQMEQRMGHTLIINNNEEIIKDYQRDIQDLTKQIQQKEKYFLIYQSQKKQYEHKILRLEQQINNEDSEIRIKQLQNKIIILQNQIENKSEQNKRYRLDRQQQSNRYIRIQNEYNNNKQKYEYEIRIQKQNIIQLNKQIINLKQLIIKLQQHNQALRIFIENLKITNQNLLTKNQQFQIIQNNQNNTINNLNQEIIRLNFQLQRNEIANKGYRMDGTGELRTIKQMDSQVDVDYDGQGDQYHRERESSIDMDRNEEGGLGQSHEIESLRASQELNVNLRQNQAFKQSFQSNQSNNNQIESQPLSESGYQYKLRPTIQRNSAKYEALLKKSQMEEEIQEVHTANVEVGDDSQKTLITSINRMSNQSQKNYQQNRDNIGESRELSQNQDYNELKQIGLDKKESSVTQVNVTQQNFRHDQKYDYQNRISQQEQASIQNDTIKNSQTNITQKTQNIINNQIEHLQNDIINKQLQQTEIQSHQNTRVHDNVLKSPSQSSQSLINSRKGDSPLQEHQFTKKQEKYQIYNASNYQRQQGIQSNTENIRLSESNRFYSDRYVSPPPLSSSSKTLHHSEGQGQQSLNSISQISTFRTQKIVQNKFKVEQSHTQIHTVTQSHLPTQSAQRVSYRQIKPEMSSIPQQRQYSSRINKSDELETQNNNITNRHINRISMDSNMSMLSKIISGNKPIDYGSNQQRKQDQRSQKSQKSQKSQNSESVKIQESQNIIGSKQIRKQQQKQQQNDLNKESKSVLSESNSIPQSPRQDQNYFNQNSKPNSILSYQQGPNNNQPNIFPIYSAKDVSMKLEEQSLSSRQSISNQSNVVRSVQLGVVVSRPVVSPPKNVYNYVENRYPSPNKVVIVQKLGRSPSPQQIQQGQLRPPQYVNPTIQRISTNYIVSSRQTSPIQSGKSINSKISHTQTNQKLFETFNPRKQNIYTQQQQKSPQSRSSVSQNRSLSPPSPRTVIVSQKVQNIPQVYRNSYTLKSMQPQVQHEQITQNIHDRERVSQLTHKTAIMQLEAPIVRKSTSLQQKNQFTRFSKVEAGHGSLLNSNNLNRIGSSQTLRSGQRPTSSATIKNTPNTESINIYGIQDQKQLKFNQVKTTSQISSPRYSNRPFTHNSTSSQIQSNSQIQQSQNEYYTRSSQSSKQQIQQDVFSSKHKIVDNLSQSNSSGIQIQQRDSMANCCPSC